MANILLVCEDHPVSRMVMERMLEKLRCRTISVDNGSEAMRCAMGEVKCMHATQYIPWITVD